VVEIRARAYARHLLRNVPDLRVPEDEDVGAGSWLLLAERKADGAPLGSIRLRSNRLGRLADDVVASFPESFSTLHVLEFSRLGVSEGAAGRMVTAALVKATYALGRAIGVDIGIALARRSTVEYFAQMGCTVEAGPLRLPGVPVPLWLVACPTNELESRLQRRSPGLHDFIVSRHHRDISVVLAEARPEMQVA
jgi:hypothetical protein